ncbi:MAG: hypothetical protein KC636_38810, partial [Myxococcales bacterium]|nr:hypothetical protein [Myxococcales bacterium]
MAEPSPADRPASVRRFAWAAATVYGALYFLPLPHDAIPGTEALARLSRPLWDALVDLLAAGTRASVEELGRPSDGSDSAYELHRCLAALLLALVGGAAAAMFGRGRRALERWAVEAAQLYLTLSMLTYGFAKVFHTQFPPLALDQLSERYGDLAPQAILWNFMSHSTSYNWITGGVEVIAGILVLWPRTRLLGAALAVAVMTNVLALDIGYEVPVRLYAGHLLLLALAVTLLDGRRLVDFFLRGRATAAPVLPQPRRPGLDRGARATLLLVAVLVNLHHRREERARFGLDAAPSALVGVYRAETDAPFSRLVINRYGVAVWFDHDGARLERDHAVDEAAGALQPRDPSDVAYAFERVDGGLVLRAPDGVTRRL